jgi:phosphoheptose isomerase
VALSTLDLYEELVVTRRAARRSGRFTRQAGAGAHVAQLRAALDEAADDLVRSEAWGARLARRLRTGGRLLTVGNGGSAAEAQHLAAELVGRLRDERMPLSAIALTPDSSAVTAIGNDYGFEEVYARQVRAHARPGDVVLLLSTSGRSRNLLEAARAARSCGTEVWAMTGPGPNPLARLCDDAVCIPGDTATVQETHLAAVHMLCRSVEAALAATPEADGRDAPLAAS